MALEKIEEDKSYLPFFKKAGALLFVVSLLNFIVDMHVTHGNYSDNLLLSIFGIILSIFVYLGSKNIACLVRSLGVFIFVALVAKAMIWFFIQPWSLSQAELRLGGQDFYFLAIARSISSFALLGIIFLIETSGAVIDMRRRFLSNFPEPFDISSIPPMITLAGVGIIIIFLVLAMKAQDASSKDGLQASALALAQSGPNYQYYVDSISYTEKYGGSIIASVLAWNQNEIRQLPITWKRK